MVRSRGLRPANGASCAVGLMMLIFFLGAAQAVPLYKMNNEIINNNDIAAAISFLLSDDAGWLTGQTLRVDGGSSIGRSANG